LVRPYLIAIVAALPAFLGITTLIELIYARQLDVGGDTLVHVWAIPMEVASPFPWITALVVAVIGIFVFRRAGRSFAIAWGRVHEIIAERMAGRGLLA
jgi:branched-chain amino acid transport system permease protein